MINISRTSDSTNNRPKLTAKIDNGDLIAIDTLMKKFGFASEENLIRFAFATLLESEDGAVYIKKGDDTIALRPSDKLLAQKPHTDS